MCALAAVVEIAQPEQATDRLRSRPYSAIWRGAAFATMHSVATRAAIKAQLFR
jgi:hypothetical protein